MRGQRGFTLIELIMTMVVVAVVSIPLAYFIAQNIEGAIVSENEVTALNLARFEMERVNNLPYNTLATNSFNNYEGYAYDVTRSVTYIEGNATTPEGLKQVAVNVVKAGGSDVEAHLVSFRSDHVKYTP